MPVPVRVYNADKTDSTDFRLVNTSNNQEFIVNVDFEVAELKIDPDYWLVSKTSEIVNAEVAPRLNEISVYPNPFTQGFSVHLPANQRLISLQLYSPEGNLIKQYFGSESFFNWLDITPGFYILRVKTQTGTSDIKIMKQ
jgi:hypothetical protein